MKRPAGEAGRFGEEGCCLCFGSFTMMPTAVRHMCELDHRGREIPFPR
jgi:hypothetical protein